MYPHERSLVAGMKDKPFVLIGVNSDPKANVQAALKRENITWRSFWDGGKTGGPIASKWDVHGWPTLFLVDHKGVIRQKWVGSPGDQVLDHEVEKLVKEAEAAATAKP